MKTYSRYILLLGCLILLTDSYAQKTGALKKFVEKDIFFNASLSFKAIDLSTGETIDAFTEHKSLTPASTLKVVTTATALEHLGRNYKYQTQIFYDGYIDKGVLYGDIYIKGVGDPTLGSEFIDTNPEDFKRKISEAVKSAGISKIEGNVIAIDNLFGYTGISRKWLWEDIGNGYAPGIYGISIYDNMCRAYMETKKPGEKAKLLYVKPDLPDLILSNELIAGNTNIDEGYASGIPFHYERRLYGSIPPNRASFPLKIDIPDPGLYLAQTINKHLQEEGITIDGTALSYRLHTTEPTSINELTTIISPPLSSIVRVINVRSNNHYAEHLYKLLNEVKHIQIAEFWKKKGLNTSSLFMYDGSGISPTNAVSTEFLTEILAYMNKKEGKDGAFFKSLPIVGKDGTVVSFLKGTSLEGKARLKSGSISNVQSYAGYIEKGDKLYAVAIIVNNYTCKRTEVRKAIEQLFIDLF